MQESDCVIELASNYEFACNGYAALRGSVLYHHTIPITIIFSLSRLPELYSLELTVRGGKRKVKVSQIIEPWSFKKETHRVCVGLSTVCHKCVCMLAGRQASCLDLYKQYF